MILDELVTLEVTIIEKVKVMMVLQKLPPSYQGLISTVLGMTKLSKIDIPYITTILRNEYECHKNLTIKNQAVVNMACTNLRKHTSQLPWQKNAQAGPSNLNQAPYNSQQNHIAQSQKWQKSNPGKPSCGKPGQGQNQNNSDKPYVSNQSPKGPN